MAQQGSGDNPDSSMDGLMIAGCIVAVVLMMWFFAHATIVSVAFYIWKFQSYVIWLFDGNINQYVAWMSKINPSEVTWHDFSILGDEFGRHTRWLDVLLLPSLAYYVYVKSPKESFKRKMDMDQLTMSERNLWPQVLPFVKLRLIDKDMSKGPWASAPTPRNYAKKNGMINIDGDFDMDKAALVFENQLGPLFTSIMKMPIHARALFTIFVLRVAGDDDASKAFAKCLATATDEVGVDFAKAESLMKDYLINEIKKNIASSKIKIKEAFYKFDFSEVSKQIGKITAFKIDILNVVKIKSIMTKLIKDNSGNRKVVALAKMHAYESTFLTSMLQIARGSGICNDTEFLCWLKPLDRTLWYAMNQTGRRVAWVEAAGVRSHWLSEITALRKIEDPRVAQAIEAMGDELASTIDAPLDPMKFRY